MNCYYHPNRSAVATCTDCGKGLCQECARKWEPVLCDDCVEYQLAARQAALKHSVILGGIALICGVVLYYLAEGDILKALFFGYMIAGIPSGWTTLNRIQPNIFLFLPIIGWVIYFLVKLILSYFVGLVAFPLNIIRCLSEMRRTKEMQDQLQ